MRNPKLYLPIILVLMLMLAGTCSLSCTGGKSTKNAPPESGTVSQEPVEKGDPDWWKKQSDLKKEEAAINETITNLSAAFTAKDTEKVLSYIAPDDREKYRGVFSKSPDIMPQIAKDMEKATLSFLSLDADNTLDRVAEYTMKVDGNTFYIVLIKIDGKWLIKNF